MNGTQARNSPMPSVRVTNAPGSMFVVRALCTGLWILGSATPVWAGPSRNGATQPASLQEAIAPDGLYAVIETTLGTIACALEFEKTPVTVGSFVGLAEGQIEFRDPRTQEWVKRPFYDGLKFHRVVKDFVVQSGDPLGDGPLRAALREAEEETGLDPAGVQLFGVLPKLYIPVSGFVVTPVLGWWREPSPVGVVDPNETARVFTVPVADLTDPANRATAMHPSGYKGPAFLVESALVWGFTAGVIDRLLHYSGWERPWDRNKQVPLDWRA